MENWESEFLQMFAFVILTVFLYQKGSAESKNPNEEEEVDKDPRRTNKKNSPWSVKKGGWILNRYEHSLSNHLSVAVPGQPGAACSRWCGDYNEEQREHGRTETVCTWEVHGNVSLLVRVVSKLAE